MANLPFPHTYLYLPVTRVFIWDFSGGSVVKESNVGDAGDVGLIPELGSSPGVGNGNTLQYCLEISMDRRAWQAIVCGVTKNWIRLSTHAGTLIKLLFH